MSTPTLQVSPLISHWQNNKSRGYQTSIALEKEYTEYSHAEAIFQLDLDNNDIQSSIL